MGLLSGCSLGSVVLQRDVEGPFGGLGGTGCWGGMVCSHFRSDWAVSLGGGQPFTNADSTGWCVSRVHDSVPWKELGVSLSAAPQL